MRALIPGHALLLLVCIVSGCYPDSQIVTEGNPARLVETLPIEPERVEDSIELIGRVEPWRDAVLYFEVPGTIEEVFVEPGDAVQKGDPIAKLVLADFDLDVQEKAALQLAADEELKQLQEGTRKEDLVVAESAHQEARVRSEYWQIELRRRERLLGKGTVTDSEVEQTRRERDAAIQRQQMTKAQWDRAVAGPRVQTVAAAVARVRAAEAAVNLAKRQLEKATLVAPFTGRVEQRMVDPGTYVNVFPAGGVPIAHLVDLTQADAVVSVPESMRSRLRGVETVKVTSAADAEVFGDAAVITLSAMADDVSGVYELRARLQNDHRSFTGGMVVLATTTSGRNTPVIRVPIGAVLSAYGQPPYVMLVDEESETARQQSVVMGAVNGNLVEIPQGLAAGDRLIVRGQHRILDGDSVQERSFQITQR